MAQKCEPYYWIYIYKLYIDRNETFGGLWGTDNVLFLDLNDYYIGVHFVKIHWAINYDMYTFVYVCSTLMQMFT